MPRTALDDPATLVQIASSKSLIPTLRLACLIRFERSLLALFSSACRPELRPRPPRLMKKVSIRIPEAGPFGETLLDASVLAIVSARSVNSPTGGCVDSVLTLEVHRDFFLLAIHLPPENFFRIRRLRCDVWFSHPSGTGFSDRDGGSGPALS